MFSKRISYDVFNCRQKSRKIECFEQSGWHIHWSVFWIINMVFWIINRVFQVHWLTFSIFPMFSISSMLSIFVSLTPCSPIRDSTICGALSPMRTTSCSEKPQYWGKFSFHYSFFMLPFEKLKSLKQKAPCCTPVQDVIVGKEIMFPDRKNW